MKDLIDDRPIEESDSSDGESDASGPTGKRKKSDDDSELDDRLEDEDYELIEENLGVKVERVSLSQWESRKGRRNAMFTLLMFQKRFKRLKRITDEESDDDEKDESMDKHRLEGALFDHSDEVNCLVCQ